MNYAPLLGKLKTASLRPNSITNRPEVIGAKYKGTCVLYPENVNDCVRFLTDLGFVLNQSSDARAPQGLEFYSGIIGIDQGIIYTPNSASLVNSSNIFHKSEGFLFPRQKDQLIQYLENGN